MKQRPVSCSWCAMFSPGSLSWWLPAASKERLPVGVWYRHETELEIWILHTATLNCTVLSGLTSLAFVSLSKNNPSSKLQIKKPKDRDNMVAGIPPTPPATPQSHPSAWPVWVGVICLNIEATDSCSLKSYTHRPAFKAMDADDTFSNVLSEDISQRACTERETLMWFIASGG